MAAEVASLMTDPDVTIVLCEVKEEEFALLCAILSEM
jgi:hypothetical protein